MQINNLMNIEIIDDLIPDMDWGLKAINVEEAWRKTKGEGVKILLIDTGVNKDHSQIAHAFKSGYNFFERSHDVTDTQGHGTHVAGLLVGKDTGVAPEAELTVMKVLDGGGNGTMASVMDGITYAINFKFDIISMSLGSQQELPIMFRERIADAYNAGITMVCATGNHGERNALYPARMNEVIAVGGIDKEYKRTDFTNRGYDVLAPSVDIFSSYKDDNYARQTGTSMASPLVAGGIALLISHYRKQGIELRPSEIQDKISKLHNKLFDIARLMD